MDTGLAWALRETQGPAATPAAPAASFRKSRRVAFDRAGCAMYFPLSVTWMAVREHWRRFASRGPMQRAQDPLKDPSVVEPSAPRTRDRSARIRLLRR